MSLIKFLAIYVLVAIICGFCWEYSIETVAALLGNHANVKLWQGVLIGLIPGLGQSGPPLAVIVWILSLILGG